ncbi:MAG: hypothetical protein EBX50_13155 [Chitinophagia bacterium]|nr:hypothetical protein [Chitinophagia bacterium]
MEIHHPQHISHQKKWKEYLLEFFMLFFAVTLGFFAENIREHYLEKQREIKFLQNIHFDLQKDLQEADTTIAYIDIKQTSADSLLLQMKNKSILNNLPDFYYYTKTLALRHLFENSTNGFTQLKNAGGLRLIENKKIVNLIQDYENRMNSMLSLQTFNENILLNLRLKSSKVLNVITTAEMNESQDINSKLILYRFTRPTNPLPLVSTKEEDINELLNLVFSTINTNKYIKARLLSLKKQAIQLDSLLLSEYGKNFD